MYSAKRILAVRCGYVLGLLLLSVGFLQAYVRNSQISPVEIISELERGYGVDLYIGNPNDHLSTLELQEQSVLQMTEPTAEWLPLALQGLKRALGVYPRELIQKYINSIHLVGNLTVQGGGAAGSFSVSRRAIYLRADDQTDIYGEQFYAETFHHEFSSLLVYLGDFPVVDWEKVNPQGFSYQYDWQGYRKTQSLENNYKEDELYTAGFLSQYAMTRFDDDVNVYAEKLFEHTSQLKALAEQHPAIKTKACLLMQFYANEAPSMLDMFSEHLSISVSTFCSGNINQLQ